MPSLDRRAALPLLAMLVGGPVGGLLLGLLGGCQSGSVDALPPAATSAPTATAAVAAPRPATNAQAEGWNDAQIGWLGYTEGLAKAHAEKKPVCLVFFTTWCGHCRNYSHVFEDARVVERAKAFVMIRLDSDKEPDIGRKYALDGGYVPRTFFLGPDGEVARDIHAPRDKFLYFYDERDPASLLAGMEAALKKLVP